MNLSARILELEGGGMHPVQVLLLRQLLTSSCCFGYMWWNKVPGFPFGGSDVRWLLVTRGFTGFMGILGMWYSMMYLPLADATVITFLAPGVAGLGCYLLLREPFTRAEQVATLVALLGVILIAQPTAFFAGPESSLDDTSSSSQQHSGSLPDANHQTTSKERLMAVGVAMLGVIGAAGAFTALRAIGKRANPVVSVNLFAVICTVVCGGALIVAPALDIDQPALCWVTPSSVKQWLLILALAALGFIMQYLLTAGLGADKSNRANAMVYTQMLFAVAFDRWVFGHSMGLMSLLGCSLILGSAISVVLAKRPVTVQPLKADDCERQGSLGGDAEGAPMLVAAGGNATSVDRDGNR
ncbi:hypothetical protein CDD81_3233 [Ophiocordyceps australis]|uniref:EamA domain-containing protein n=1 Tax=Ophiocordyceps australis TaxID=1399860 RepID=A0A2C5XWR0_9HYPO|nr:hypothetical protein CDD81_3233 [Ophiocordyceps australis]